jgi:DNA helicase-2/ATP-dependent DNA helicase PcrA
MINIDDLNPPQQKAVTTIEGPILIIAGAGSGKTRVITYRIAAMLEEGIPQSAILALTFTNKAAREMEIRVKELTGKKLQNLTVSTFHAFGVTVLREEIEALRN